MKDNVIAKNSSAFRDFSILESFECGIELKGSEVKSIREGNANLKDSFARIEEEEVLLYNTHITPYEKGSYFNVDPKRVRRLLLHKSEIRRILSRVSQRGLTLVPLKFYFKKGFVKVELGLVKGKKLYDKRAAIKERELDLEMKRELRRRR
ncbi:MAG TPA: SsrA-binding protein SmpB [Candidatus Omnitrophota bacterium]|nr:SsrA-binding protein SmpB [Candidatus Omnitrophota bacterium]